MQRLNARHSIHAGILAVAVCVSSACVDPNVRDIVSPGNYCTVQIILVMKDRSGRPSGDVIGSLAEAAKVDLTFLRNAGTDSYVFSLGAVGSEDSCMHGVERLRTDSRLQSVEMDARRQGN
jgi:hypothetical protein